MSRTTLGFLIVTVAVGVAVLLVVQPWDDATPGPVEIDTLDAWVAFSKRPGFALLDKKALDDYFIAIYRTEADELAYCYRWRGEGDAPNTSLSVLDGQGDRVGDAQRSASATALNPTGPLPAGGFVHGMVIPIRKDHEGVVVAAFRDSLGAPDTIPARDVYSRSVKWTK